MADWALQRPRPHGAQAPGLEPGRRPIGRPSTCVSDQRHDGGKRTDTTGKQRCRPHESVEPALTAASLPLTASLTLLDIGHSVLVAFGDRHIFNSSPIFHALYLRSFSTNKKAARKLAAFPNVYDSIVCELSSLLNPNAILTFPFVNG